MKKGTLIIAILLLATVAQAQTALKLQERVSSKDSLKKIYPPFAEGFKPVPVKYNYYQSLGAACKVEWKLEQATKVPFRFRLGSLQQTDYMEQKPNAQKPQ